MKSGKSLPELAQELQRQLATRADYVAPTPKVQMGSDATLAGLINGKTFTFTEHAYGQLADDCIYAVPWTGGWPR